MQREMPVFITRPTNVYDAKFFVTSFSCRGYSKSPIGTMQ